jgi:hypothetical protein
VRHVAEYCEGDIFFGEFEGYDVVVMKEAASILEPGKPALPLQTIRIAVPSGLRATAMRARSLRAREIPGAFDILPAQHPETTREGIPRETTVPDRAVYGLHLPWPGQLATLDRTADLAGQGIAWVNLYPVQYVPARKTLVFHDLVEVILTCAAADTQGKEIRERYTRFTESQRRHYEETLRRLVVNPEDVVLDPPGGERSPVLPEGQYEHVVITSSSYAASFEPLVDWHTQKGLRDTVVTTGWIYASYEGPGDTLKIRQFVSDASSSWGTIYFLLGGEGSTVPFVYRNYMGDNTPSDQYYSDYDDDWTHEVCVGRATVQSTGEADTFVQKVLTYEKNPPLTDYPLEILLVGMDLDGETPCEELMETIAGYIPPYFDITKVYDSEAANHRTEAIDALNSGANLVNHADHAASSVIGLGSVHHGWYLSQSDVDALANDDRLSIVVSTGCLSNAMDYEDAISESAVMYNAGQAAVAWIGNTRYGLYSPGLPESLSAQLDRELWEGVFLFGQCDLGRALQWSKHHFPNMGSFNRHCEWTFCLLGEPAMPLWLDTPGVLTVTHPARVTTGRRDIPVIVEDESGPVAEARVCLRKEGDVYAVAVTESSGQAVLTVRSARPGTMTITVTAQDALPYEGTIEVTQNTFALPIER